jgi:hypothetical protein
MQPVIGEITESGTVEETLKVLGFRIDMPSTLSKENRLVIGMEVGR